MNNSNGGLERKTDLRSGQSEGSVNMRTGTECTKKQKGIFGRKRLLQMNSKCWTNDVSGRLNRWRLLKVFGLALLRSIESEDELNRSVQIREGLHLL